MRRFSQVSTAYVLIAPAILATVVFFLIPMVVSGYWSLTEFNGVAAPRFVGLDNFAALLGDPRFVRAFQNTVFFVVVGMGIGPALGLGTALMLNQAVRFRSLFRVAFFLPTMTAIVAIATIWKLLYNQGGLINAILSLFGLPGHNWLSDPTTSLPAVTLMSIWQGFGFETVVFLAALQAIPKEYLEAATVDGAGTWAKFRYVTLPALRPTIVFLYIVGIIGSFQTFDAVYVMTQGGPLQSTTTVIFYLVDKFNSLQLGMASAVAYLLLVILAILSFLQLRFFDRPER